MAYVLRVCGPADGPVLTGGVRHFVADYDPNRMHRTWFPLPGGGSMVLTSLRTQGHRFDDAADALDYWRQQSATMPLRADGEPNRPMTSLHVMVEEVP